MNPNAQKWVDALRSGDYAQITGRLRKADGYCCHGVACQLFAEENPSAEWIDESDGLIFQYGARRADVMPPPPVLARLGLGAFYAQSLAEANDSGKSFCEIADMIEDYFHE